MAGFRASDTAEAAAKLAPVSRSVSDAHICLFCALPDRLLKSCSMMLTNTLGHIPLVFVSGLTFPDSADSCPIRDLSPKTSQLCHCSTYISSGMCSR